jgi:hypothetical protein
MKNEYASKWAEYRRICKCGLLSLVTFLLFPFVIIPVFGLLLRFSMFGFLERSNMILFLFEGALMFATLYFAWCQYTWECPRCGEPFGRLHAECQNCALPKWANENDSDLSRDDVESGRAEWPKPRI